MRTEGSLDNILAMRSVYAIRIFELLQERIKSKRIPLEGIEMELSLDYIKDCCGCQENKAYRTFSNFKTKVLNVAVKEINRVTTFHIDYKYRKKGRAVVGIIFHITMNYHPDPYKWGAKQEEEV